MSSFKSSIKKIMVNTPEFNFSIKRDNKLIGKMQGIPVNNSDYLHVISTTVDIEKGDHLTNNLNQNFTVIKTEIVNGIILRIYFSK